MLLFVETCLRRENEKNFLALQKMREFHSRLEALEGSVEFLADLADKQSKQVVAVLVNLERQAAPRVK